MRYALVNPSNQVDRFGDNINPNVGTKAGWRWLPCPIVSVPSYDPASQVREGPTYVVGASEVTETYSVRVMTAQELSDAKDAAVNGLNGSAFAPLFKALYNLNNRVRVLEGQATLTPAQFKAAIKGLL